MLMTWDEVINAIVEKDVAKWGEGARAAALRLRRQNMPTIGLAMNALAHYDPENIDAALAAEAKKLLTPDDWRVLKRGG